jgi:hypothetical protein
MKTWIHGLAAIALIALGGCADLKPVRDFANTSADLSGYQQLTNRYITTYDRTHLYIPASQDAQAKALDAKRKAAADDLLKVQLTVSLYMQALATLAGEDTYDVSKGIQQLSGGIKANPETNLKAAEVDAAANIASLLAKWVSSGQQERAVKSTLRDGATSFQILLSAMNHLVSIYKQTNQLEQDTVLKFYERQLLINQRGSTLLLTLARVQQEEKIKEYQRDEKAYANASAAIQNIASGHQELMKNLDDLTNKELVSTLKRLVKDLQATQKNLQAFH